MGNITEEAFGHMPDGQEVRLFTLTNQNGLQVKITPYGGRITSILVPDNKGQLVDVVLGYSDLAGYLADESNFGAIIGRVSNRIAKGQFTLDGQTYNLAINNGPNHLHGGLKGFAKVIWQAKVTSQNTLELTYRSPDGEEGYPGNLTARVIYSILDNNELRIEISAETDKPTPVNLTSHSYFNLTGGTSTILNHQLYLNADAYIAVDETVIPTGETPTVHHTPMDFTQPLVLGSSIAKTKGYDNTFVLNKTENNLSLAAWALDLASGRQVEVYTTQPGIHFYTANHLDGSFMGKHGQPYQQYQGFTLETNRFPDAPNQPTFPNTILRPGETFQEVTVYRFTVR
ncbi:galactose mutarotase [Adhaeribacter swui]|uniref:Aldose 1-epimerase n=1 Tax=Adhaeribacter swui TaxID=2086471 RepID=A0A7G7GA22_9BACT|nr:aldose epimerase family protein [Adhaeribacter swui]QNF34006.1 galactose mutarotase [Adhaeribacter swui]